MAVTTIQFGQCGNQTGHHLFSLLSKDLNITKPDSVHNSTSYYNESIRRWFRSKADNDNYVARAVLVDTEQKVLSEIKQKQSSADSTWKYDQTNMISHKGGGAGNNWAYGYGRKGSELEEIITECVRKEVEKCDRLLAILGVLSSAGGTGSGVGSYIIELLRDTYSTKSILSAVVLPYNSGEVVIQNYNTVLTLAKLYDVSDMCIVFQNDHLHKMSVNLLKNKNTDLYDLNDLIAIKMGSIFQPLEWSESGSIYDIISHLTPHPHYKFVTVKSTPHHPKQISMYEAKLEWNVLVNHMKQTLRVSYLENEPLYDWETKSPRPAQVSQHSLAQYVPSVSNLLVSRGTLASDDRGSFALPLQDVALYPQFVPKESRCLHLHQNRKFLNMEKFISLITNNSLISYPINDIVEKGWKTYIHRAHLHQYSKFDINEAEFLEAFAKMETIIQSYKELK